MSHTNLPLIARTALFSDPDRSQVRLSPDGTQIAFLAPRNDVPNLWLAATDAVDAVRPLTDFRGRGIAGYGWAAGGRHLYFIRDENGDENWRLYAISLDDGALRDLTPFDGVQARIVAVSDHVEHEILIGLNRRVPQLHDVYRLNLADGEMELIEENAGFAGYLADQTLALRLAIRMTPDGTTEWHLRAADGTWTLWQTVPYIDSVTTNPLGFDATGNILTIQDSRARDTAAVIAVDVSSGNQRLLAEDARVDAGQVLTHPMSHRVEAVAFTYQRTTWQIVEPALADDFARLQAALSGDIEVVSRTRDDARWVVFDQRDNHTGMYHLYNRSRGTLTPLFGNRTALDGVTLATMQPVIIHARDGQALVSYLSLPADCATRDGIPLTPQPLVLLPHGGPWGRDVWGFNSWHQWLTNRGYAVLSVNFRSSTGFGKAFVNAGDNEWGGKIMADQVDAVQWAIDLGIADAQRVAIVGGSFGGYSALAGVTFYPDLFACAVSIVGPSNLMTLLASIPPYWAPIYEHFARRIGDPRTEEGRALLRAHSPLTHVDRIVRPLLIGQGANDPRVKQAESDQIVAAMQARGIPVTYVLYPDEGHGFGRAVNRYSFYAIAEAFLARWLGGRAEPAGAALEAGSQQIVAGAELIPALATAG